MRKRVGLELVLLVAALAGPATAATLPSRLLHLSHYQPESYANASLISLASGHSFDARSGAPVLPEELRAADRAPGPAYYLVQTAGPACDARQQALARCGAQVVDYVPNYTYVVRMDGPARDRVAVLPLVDFLGPFHPAYKLSPANAGAPTDTFVALLFTGERLAPAVAAARALGFDVLETSASEGVVLFTVRAEPAQLGALARLDAVRWIEPWYPVQYANQQAQWVVQTGRSGNRRIWDVGLRGEGQVITTCDSGIRMTHDLFRDDDVPVTGFGDYPGHRKVIGYWPATGSALFGDEAVNYYHGTHTAGTACGDDGPAGGTSGSDGIAIRARNFFTDGGGAAPGIVVPSDLSFIFGRAYTGNAGGAARIAANSWGAKVFGYTTLSYSVDAYMWLKRDFLVCFANGNIDYGWDSLAMAPATAKSALSVGACENGLNASMVATWSAFGPTPDGRTKPTVIAPGVLTSADGAGDAGYVLSQGTSMACPTAAGAAALVRQYCTEGWYPSGAKNPADGFTPSAALVKALLVNSAVTRLGFYDAPEKHIGWGRVCLDSVLYFPGDRRRLELIDYDAGISTGQEVCYPVRIADGGLPVKVTLVWTDYPGNPSTVIQLRNDLDLVVEDPLGVPYRGNNYGPNGESSSGGSSDTVNVEECVRRSAPAVGTWTVRVRGRNVAHGPQPFALVVTGGLAASGPDLVIARRSIDDAGASVPNGQLDPGETVRLGVALRNDGATSAGSVQGTLSSTSPYVTVTTAQAAYGTIPSGDTSSGDGFVVRVAAGAPRGESLPFEIAVSADGGYRDTLGFTEHVHSGVAEADPVLFRPTCSAVVDGRRARISFTADRTQVIDLSIWDVTGRRVIQLWRGRPTGLRQLVLWDGTDSSRHPVSWGSYFVILTTPDGSRCARLLLRPE